METGTLAQIVADFISLGALLYSIVLNKSRASIEALTKLAEKIAEFGEKVDVRFQALESRVSRLETEMQHLPDHGTVTEMKLAMVRLEGKVEALVERIDPVKAAIERMQEFLEKQALAPPIPASVPSRQSPIRRKTT